MSANTLPIDWCCDFVLVTGLQRVDNAENFGGVAASACRIREDSADGLLWIDHEDTANCESNALFVDVGGILVVDPTCTSVNVWLFQWDISH